MQPSSPALRRHLPRLSTLDLLIGAFTAVGVAAGFVGALS